MFHLHLLLTLSISKMIFGFSPSDFIKVSELAWSVYKACKDAPEEFREIAQELSSVHITLREFQDEVNSPNSRLNKLDSKRENELKDILRNISDVLLQFQQIVTRYQSLSRKQKKTWD